MILVFNLIGIILIVSIIWWFWGSKSKAISATSNHIKIAVKDGVYDPARIKVHSAQPIIIEFTRKDSSPCSEYVIFETLNRQEKLPINKSFKINLGKLQPGTYPFNCQMKMYTGELIVS